MHGIFPKPRMLLQFSGTEAKDADYAGYFGPLGLSRQDDKQPTRAPKSHGSQIED